MSATNQTGLPDHKPHRVAVVDLAMVIFYIMTWGNFLYVAAVAVNDTHDGQYAYLLPAGLYALVLLSSPVRNLPRFLREGGSWLRLLWGVGEGDYGDLVYIGASLALIIWMSALNLTFVSLYFPLWSITFGMLSWRLRLAALVLSLEVGAFTVQIGLLAALLNGSVTFGEFGGYLISGFFFITFVALFSLLIRSRIQSEHLIHELQATKQQLEAALAQEKEVAVLRERTRMAREMHDGLGHALSLVAVKIEAAQRLQAVDPARAAAELEATKALVRQSMTDLRASLADLRSPAFEADAQPLSQALQTWATRTAQENRFAIACQFEPGADTLPAPIQDALWRVGREAVLNVLKHARAQQVELHIFCKDQAVYLSVRDDGVGIPRLAEGEARLEVEGHYGVRGMRERLEALGGQLTVRAGHDGHGTLVLASIPLPPPEAQPAQRLRDRLSPAKSLLTRRS
jgi:signal transduction histidine kinase